MVLLAGLAWTLTSLVSEPGDSGGKSSALEQTQAPVPNPGVPDSAGGVIPDAGTPGDAVSNGSGVNGVPDSGASGEGVQTPPQVAPVPPAPEPAPVAEPVPVPAPAPVVNEKQDKAEKPQNEKNQKGEGKKGKDKQKGIVGEDGDQVGGEEEEYQG